MHLTMKSLVVIILVPLLVLAVTLTVLVVSNISWAAAQEWLSAPTPCECILDQYAASKRLIHRGA
jgi:hypothetical protein